MFQTESPSFAASNEEEHQGGHMIRWLIGAISLGAISLGAISLGAISLGAWAGQALAAEPVEIGIGYLRHAGTQSTLSLVEQPSENDGIAGARLAIEDNDTTG